MSEAVIQHPGPELIFDMWEYILLKHTGPSEVFDAEWLQKTQYTCHGFAKILRPLIYRHVNLRCFADAISFFSTISLYQSLASSVQTLQFSFDLGANPKLGRYGPEDSNSDVHNGDDSSSESGHSFNVDSGLPQPEHQEFWAAFIECMPKLVQLKKFSISYSHSDLHFLHRLLRFGNLTETLPRTVQTMHMKPLPEDYNLESEDLISEHAWNSTLWRLDISLIPHIHTLILTTPSYLIWPPTTKRFKAVIQQWTAQFRHKTQSLLKEIVVNFAFSDEGVLVQEWEEETGEKADEVYEDKRAVGGGYGTQIVLQPNAKKSWVSIPIFQSSHSNREEYFFGSEGRDYLYPWTYLDEGKAAKIGANLRGKTQVFLAII
ncbi:hypothetical protein B0H13DRAFT_2337394 [Mycena leptocephala]|nr:hypothetical protein B0H13DRAFT_2337394 [Mycena leptocephala]